MTIVRDWSGLMPGDSVDIVAPASMGNPKVVEKLQELLSSWGLRSRVPDDLFGESLLYANSDEKRFEHLYQALKNLQSKAVWCLLGGFGSANIIPLFSQVEPPQQSKIFIGFSDITALHIFLQGQWGWKTIHGPSGYQVALKRISNDSIQLLKQMIFHPSDPIQYHNIIPLNDNAKKNGSVNAPIIGGNLNIMTTSLGTPWQINASGKIIFIEEINERAYRVDRALTHLMQAGVFQQAQAILFGDVIDKGEPDGRFLVDKILQQFANQSNIPVLQISNIGHGSSNNPLLLGAPATLSYGDLYNLSFER